MSKFTHAEFSNAICLYTCLYGNQDALIMTIWKEDKLLVEINRGDWGSIFTEKFGMPDWHNRSGPMWRIDQMTFDLLKLFMTVFCHTMNFKDYLEKVIK